jgi:DnaJ-class molecular chaperone
MATCPQCNGEGVCEYEIEVVDHYHGGYLDTEVAECDLCNGSGEVDE